MLDQTVGGGNSQLATVFGSRLVDEMKILRSPVDMGGTPKIVVFPPTWMVKIMETPIKMDDFGGSLIFGNTHMENIPFFLIRKACFCRPLFFIPVKSLHFAIRLLYLAFSSNDYKNQASWAHLCPPKIWQVTRRFIVNTLWKDIRSVEAGFFPKGAKDTIQRWHTGRSEKLLQAMVEQEFFLPYLHGTIRQWRGDKAWRDLNMEPVKVSLCHLDWNRELWRPHKRCCPRETVASLALAEQSYVCYLRQKRHAIECTFGCHPDSSKFYDCKAALAAFGIRTSVKTFRQTAASSSWIPGDLTLGCHLPWWNLVRDFFWT